MKGEYLRMKQGEKIPVIAIGSGTLTTADGIARCLGITRQRVVQLCQSLVLEKEDNGKYNVSKNIQKYLAYKCKDQSVDYQKEHSLLEKAKRETAELELQKMKGEVHETADIELMVGTMITVAKRALLSIPHKLSKQLEGKTAAEINEILKDEINESLIELSKFDASKLGEADDTEEDN